MRRLGLLTSLFIALLFSGTTLDAGPRDHDHAGQRRFEFALIGDLPYNAEQEQQFVQLMNELDRSKLSFVIFDGDFKSGSSVCSDAVFEKRKAQFDASEHPFIYVPGDNEWTDCHRANNGAYDPLERLTKLRQLFFSDERSLGQDKLKLNRQSDQPEYSKFRENVRWHYGKITFVGLNVPGSNNNFGRSAEMDAEYHERNAANLAWMRQAFALAKARDDAGIMIAIQANPGFELPASDPQRTGYNDFLKALETETLGFAKPVVLVHGDSHYFRIDKPLMNSKNGRRLENFTRVETFGSPDVHWIKVAVDPKDAAVFTFRQGIVADNIVNAPQ